MAFTSAGPAARCFMGARTSPLRGITPIIDFIANAYGNCYAPNTRETIRDDALSRILSYAPTAR